MLLLSRQTVLQLSFFTVGVTNSNVTETSVFTLNVRCGIPLHSSENELLYLAPSPGQGSSLFLWHLCRPGKSTGMERLGVGEPPRVTHLIPGEFRWNSPSRPLERTAELRGLGWDIYAEQQPPEARITACT